MLKKQVRACRGMALSQSLSGAGKKRYYNNVGEVHFIHLYEIILQISNLKT